MQQGALPVVVAGDGNACRSACSLDLRVPPPTPSWARRENYPVRRLNSADISRCTRERPTPALGESRPCWCPRNFFQRALVDTETTSSHPRPKRQHLRIALVRDDCFDAFTPEVQRRARPLGSVAHPLG